MHMQRYELAKLESIIVSDLSAFIERRYSVDSQLVSYFKKHIDEEVERIKVNFVNYTFNFPKKRMRQIYVQHHEQAIIRLAGHLTSYVPPSKMYRPHREMDNVKLCRLLYESLQELLEFIEQHFSTYFDRQAWIPHRFHLIVQAEFEKNVPVLQRDLLKKGYSSPLINLVLSVVEEFIQSKSSKYYHVIYLKQLQNKLFELIAETQQPVEDDSNFLWLLFEMNFNLRAYYYYATHVMKQFVDKSSDQEDRLGKLTTLLKLMRQRIVLPGYAFDPNQNSIQQQLIQWVELEINYSPQPNLSSGAPNDPLVNDSMMRVKVDLSVAQLAYFIRLLIESNVLHQDNITALIRKITQTFETKRADSISVKSFENRYYDVESATQESIRNILQKMLLLIDQSNLD